MKTRLFPSWLMLALAGCASDGPLYKDAQAQSSPDTTQVVLYRDFLPLSGAAWPHHYYIDNQLVAELKIGGFT